MAFANFSTFGSCVEGCVRCENLDSNWKLITCQRGKIKQFPNHWRHSFSSPKATKKLPKISGAKVVTIFRHQKPRGTWITCRKASSFAFFSKNTPPVEANFKSGVERKDFSKKPMLDTLEKKKIKDFNPKRWLRKLFEKPIV